MEVNKKRLTKLSKKNKKNESKHFFMFMFAIEGIFIVYEFSHVSFE